MSLAFFMDVHVPKAITLALRLRGVDVLTAQEDQAHLLDDAELLNRSAILGRVLFSQDADLLREASARQRSGANFPGLIYAHQLNATIGQCVEDLELIARTCEPADLEEQVIHIPIR